MTSLCSRFDSVTSPLKDKPEQEKINKSVWRFLIVSKVDVPWIEFVCEWINPPGIKMVNGVFEERSEAQRLMNWKLIIDS